MPACKNRPPAVQAVKHAISEHTLSPHQATSLIHMLQRETDLPIARVDSGMLDVRAQRMKLAHDNYIGYVAETTHMSVESVQAEFVAHMNAAVKDPNMHPHPRFVKAWLNNPDHHHLPRDRSSLCAYQHMAKFQGSITFSQVDSFDQLGQERCHDCGQWMSTDGGHHCVAQTSEQGRAFRQEMYSNLGEPTPPVLPLYKTQYYETAAGMLRTKNMNDIHTQLDNHQTILAAITYASDTETVSGHVEVTKIRQNMYVCENPKELSERQLKCTCPQYQETYNCPHVGEAVNAMNETITPPNVEETQTVLNLVENRISEASITANNYRQHNIPQPTTIDLNNPTTLQQYLTEAENLTTTPYLKTDNALGMGNREFGIELEYSYPNSWTEKQIHEANTRIGQELYAHNLTDQPTQQMYHTSQNTQRHTHEEGWRFEQDTSTGATVETMFTKQPKAGGEIISPIMADTKETWNNIETVTNILKKHGAITSVHTGLHVHVNTPDYDHDPTYYNRLIANYQQHENTIYHQATNPETGIHRTHTDKTYAATREHNTTSYTNISEVLLDTQDTTRGLNITNVGTGHTGHIEYRMFDGTHDPGTIQTHIGLAVGFTNHTNHSNHNPTPVPNTTASPTIGNVTDLIHKIVTNNPNQHTHVLQHLKQHLQVTKNADT